MMSHPQHDSVVGIILVECNYNFISSLCKKLGLCGLAEKINVSCSNSRGKNPVDKLQEPSDMIVPN